MAALAIEGEAAAGRPATRSTRSRSQTSRRQKAAQAQAESHAVWERLGTLCSANERRADEASRDVQAWLKCVYMRDRIGDRYRGHITGVAPFGVFVTLDDLYVEGMVHVSELGSEYFRYDEAGQVLIGEIRDMEAMGAAIAYAQSGHLVLATLHANNAVVAVS